ncbi:hypothetical protein [Plasmodium yoelii yoelii]|uniref:Uncharacterized protein n=1 Tax=Plasmodium yoelii yoelii TaxID=73239 RepID=Q7RGV0_PLAYO|nr:hypothetical protein [Plasmodium yoelii yoelii]
MSLYLCSIYNFYIFLYFFLLFFYYFFIFFFNYFTFLYNKIKIKIQNNPYNKMNAAPVIVGGVRTPARRRPNPSGSQASNTNQGRNSGASNTILKIYGDDSPGFKL